MIALVVRRLPILLILPILFIPALLAPVSAQSSDGYWWTNDRARNPTKGGWVSGGAYVEEHVFIAPSARVEGSASVTGDARIYGNAVVRGQASVGNRARVYGSAIVEGNAVIVDKAQIFGNAVVGGDAYVGGEARVGGYARLKTGEYESGLLSPARPQAEIDAEQRAEAQRQYQVLYLKLDQTLSALNGKWSHVSRDYYATLRQETREQTDFEIKLERRGGDLHMDIQHNDSTRAEIPDQRPRITGTNRRSQGKASLASLMPGMLKHDEKTQSYSLELRWPDDGSASLVSESEWRSLFETKRERRQVRHVTLHARSAAPLDAFINALKAVQKASPPS